MRSRIPKGKKRISDKRPSHDTEMIGTGTRTQVNKGSIGIFLRGGVAVSYHNVAIHQLLT